MAIAASAPVLPNQKKNNVVKSPDSLADPVYNEFFETLCTISVVYSTKCRVFHVIFFMFYTRVKVKCTLVKTLRLCTGRTAHRGSRDIALLFHDHGTRRG
jgi:hypothetical protein